MVIKCPRKSRTHVKAKKGQILILTIIVMAIGLIVISPLLAYLDSSYSQYLHELNRTTAYYAADAMMENILNDLYQGVDIYNQNASTPYNQNGSNYLGSGYDISVAINNSILYSLGTPQGSSNWSYLDPGITTCNTSSCDSSTLLGSLATGATHNYSLYLVGGNQVQVNWAVNEAADPVCGWILCFLIIPCYVCCPTTCPNHSEGSMQMLYPNGSLVAGTAVNGSLTNAPLTLNFNWSVPEGTSGNYTIRFTNGNTYRKYSDNVWLCNCNVNDSVASTVFSASGATDHTWVRVGKEIGGEVYSYQDYMITAKARRANHDILSIIAYVRQSPGPITWWKDQIIEIPSWQIIYY